MEWENRQRKWRSRRKKRTKKKVFSKKMFAWKRMLRKKKRSYQRHCLQKWLPRHRNAHDKIFIVQMCTINDVSVTIPERYFNAFFMHYYIHTPCVETFIFNQCCFDLFAFEVQWLLRFSIYCLIPRGIFIGSRCVFKCNTVNIKRTHTHTPATISYARYVIYRLPSYRDIILMLYLLRTSHCLFWVFFLQTNDPNEIEWYTDIQWM